MSFYSDTHLLKVERFGDVIDLSPDLNPVSTSFGIPIVVIKIKGMSLTSGFPFRRLHTSKPSSPGIMTCRKIRSFFNFRMSPRELYPSKATEMLYPVLVESRCKTENIWPSDIDNH
jgi:hypothetical protein